MLQGIVIFIHVLLSIALIALVLRHSGKDAGLGSIGGGVTSGLQGGTHVLERNTTRLTIIVALCYAVTTFALHRLFE
jgi:preprotein translocase subunit SecG